MPPPLSAMLNMATFHCFLLVKELWLFEVKSEREFSLKEVIQPQVPLRLPCYDFTPIIGPTVDGCLYC